jgi:hypothetical protein
VLVALAAAPAALVAACRDSPTAAPPPTGSPTSPAAPDPLAEHLAAERRLLAGYQATIARHPSLATRLAPLRDDHVAHVAALGSELGIAPPSGTAPAGTTGPASPTATPTPEASARAAVPGTPAGAVAALRAAERAAAAARSAACLTASPDRAPLLASIAACEASHGVLLS